MHVEPVETPSPSDLPSRSAWLRFFDTFLQEKNIKWMLGLGGLILFASSLMLVTSHWQNYTPLWKSLVVLGYTAILYILGEIAYRQVGLRRTGTSLFATTVLLIPISFLAARVVHTDQGQIASILGVLFACSVFAAIAGRRILLHFLREDQPTFLASYLILSLAGAIVPVLSEAHAVPAALVLWAVFAAGAIKVDRHVFWLGEEHRLPRIFGFFPILLLGTQFLTLFAFLAPSIELPWIGFGMVLTAIPVLMTADALANVFEERTGNLVRPLPWSLVLPVLVGIVLSISGVCLAWMEFPRSYAAVPTAILTAVIFVQTARRTRHPGFVWAMWVSVVLCYQSSPVFFRELAQAVVHQGAEAVSESRLPLAFYGLTYLPLLMTATWLATVWNRRDRQLFAGPTRQFVMGMTTLLWLVSLTHAKAIFPVGVATLGMFALEMIVFRVPRLRFGLVAAWITTSFGLTPFMTQVLSWNVPPETFLWVMTASTAMLLLPDRFLSSKDRKAYAIGDVSSLLLTMILAVVWVGYWIQLPMEQTPRLSGLMLTVLLLGHAVRWCVLNLSLLSLLFAGLYAVLMAHSAGVATPVITSSALLAAGGLWLVALGLKRVPDQRISRGFGEATARIANGVLIVGLFAFSFPLFAKVIFGNPMELWWISTLVPVAWTFAAARRFRSEVWTGFGCLGVLGFVGAVTVTILGREAGWHWMPLVWSLVGLIAVPVAPRPFRWNRESDDDVSPALRYVTAPLGQFLTVLFVILAVGTLPFFSIPARAASLVSLAGLFWLAGDWQNAWLRYLGLGLFNGHILSGVLQVFAPEAGHLLELNRLSLLASSLPLAMTAALSRLCWNLSSRPAGTGLGEWVNFQRLMLLGVTCFGLMWSVNFLPVGLTVIQVLLSVGVFAVLMGDQIWQAVKSQDEAHVWIAEATILAAVGYLLLFDVIRFGSGLSMYAVLLTGFAAWTVGSLTSNARRWQVLSQPMLLTGYSLPAVTVALGVVRHFTVPESLWLGMNSLALLLAGGFYFWRGIEEKHKTWLISSAVILNVALALLWRELDWLDPQLFAVPIGMSIIALVQGLKDEIPAKAHDPLRYLGALVILVSPVFDIVGGSWIHLMTLMIASVAVTLAAMGLRIRALMYTGTAFLIGDLIAMVVRGSIDNPTLLWIAGILVGLSVISLAAYCEKHREQVLDRLRLLAARLETWE